jgi:cyclic pyranopterin phosphate synthase
MVDVGDKAVTDRRAVASVRVSMRPEVLGRLREGSLEKGNAVEMARVAGILAAKRTSDLLPLCHPVRLSEVRVDFEFDAAESVRVVASVRGQDRTGFEMEALTAAAMAGLALYDACKMHQKDIRLLDLGLEEKRGGKSGDFRRRDPGGEGSDSAGRR